MEESQRVRIVGVGASAGGLEAISQLIAHLNRLLKFTQPSTPAEQREKMTASPDEQ